MVDGDLVVEVWDVERRSERVVFVREAEVWWGVVLGGRGW